MGESTGQEMTKYEKKNNIERILGDITNHLGKIEIAGNQIICHVNNKKLDKCLKDNDNTLNLKGFTESDKLRLEALYGIGKTIKYVIEDYRFNDVFLDTIGDTTLQFNNCIFEGNNLNFGYVNNIIFYNSSFYLDNELNIFNNKGKKIENVKIIDCRFGRCLTIPGMDNMLVVSDKLYINGTIIYCSKSINFVTNEVTLSNTSIYHDESLYKGNTNIYSNKYIMNNSLISGEHLRIVSPNMKVRNSTFDSCEMSIVNKNCDIGELKCGVDTTTKYNDITLLPYRKYYITPASYELLKERERLANVLYQLNEKCEEEVKKKVRILKNKSIEETVNI